MHTQERDCWRIKGFQLLRCLIGFRVTCLLTFLLAVIDSCSTLFQSWTLLSDFSCLRIPSNLLTRKKRPGCLPANISSRQAGCRNPVPSIQMCSFREKEEMPQLFAHTQRDGCWFLLPLCYLSIWGVLFSKSAEVVVEEAIEILSIFFILGP